jgi:hypothetical protein
VVIEDRLVPAAIAVGKDVRDLARGNGHRESTIMVQKRGFGEGTECGLKWKLKSLLFSNKRLYLLFLFLTTVSSL